MFHGKRVFHGTYTRKMDRRANISVIYKRIGSRTSSPLSFGLSYNINKGSFRTGVLRNRGRGLVRAMLAMSGKGGML